MKPNVVQPAEPMPACRPGSAPSPGRWVLLAALLLASSLAATAEETSIPPTPEATPEQRAWLELVDLLITDEEREYYLSIEEEYRRQAFVDAFWKERDPDPRTHLNELQIPWDEHASMARARYETLLDGRARVLLLRGEPFTYCIDRTRALETWYYEVGDKTVFPVTLLTYSWNRPYEVWSTIRPLEPVQRRKVGTNQLQEMCGHFNPDLATKEITRYYKGERYYDAAVEAFLEPPEAPSKEWLSTHLNNSTQLPPGAETFPAEMQLTFPGHHQQRTVLQGLVAIPASAVATVEQAPSYRFALVGEIVRGDRIFEGFRYQFELPADRGPTLPLVFQRYLRPGPAKLLVKVEDLYGRRFALLERDLEVPRIDHEAPVPRLEDSELFTLLAEADAATARGEHVIRLLPPPQTVLTGLVRFKTFTSGALEKVTFFLDDKPVLTKRRAPFTVELDLGDTPAPHRLRVGAFDARGTEVARDELQLNPGGQRFRVRLTEPRSDETHDASARAVVDIQVPDGEELDRLELFLDERRVAVLHQPPYVQPLLLPAPGAMVYVRAVGYLTDGNASEDVVFLNAPDVLEEIDVQMVEVYATVHDRQGRPVAGLQEADFRVEEDGNRQSLRRFEWVSDLPIHAGLLLDVSASMEDSLETVTAAGLRFIEEAVTPKDRLALITFNERPEVAMRFTNEIPTLQASLQSLRANGGTALYDSLVFALHYFHGIRGQKALLLLSDGHDESSTFAFEDTLEYAYRAGVTIYAIGLQEAAREKAHRKVLRQIAEETGGRAFFVEDLDELEAIYDSIQTELRGKYLLAYQSTSDKDSALFRRVEVKVDGREVRAMSGYYP